MTAQEAADEFVAQYNGQYIDEDKAFGSQCWDVVARYAREKWGCTPFPTTSGGAEGLWRFYAQPIPLFFDKVPASDLQAGDIAVWSADFYPPYGHTSLVWRRETSTTFWSFEQNGSNDPNHDGIADGVAYLAERTITSKLAGGLRPKGAEDMADIFNEGDRVNINDALYGSDKGYHKEFVDGKTTYKNAVEKIMESPQYISESRLNSGDIVNIKNATGWPADADKVQGWFWKRFWEDYAGKKVALEHQAGAAQFEQIGTINNTPVFGRKA